MRFTKCVGILTISAVLSACSWFGGDKEEPDVPEDQLYQEAITALEEGEYGQAVKQLETLEARYPFGRYSEQAQLELIYAYHKDYQPEAARAAADRFIRLHPNHENIDYAYYLKGVSAFEQDRTFLERYLPIDVSQRDPGAALESFDSFSTLLSRYPDSQYAPDARKRMVFLKNRLAQHEVNVAEYYLRREAFVAAANRGRYVVENLKDTPSVPRALEIMYQAYTELGMDQLAGNSKEVLTANYPNYRVRTYQEENHTFLETVTFGLVGGGDKVTELEDEPYIQDEPVNERPWYHKATFGIFE
jgi:outer membrane protein assembly factor BamD